MMMVVTANSSRHGNSLASKIRGSSFSLISPISATTLSFKQQRQPSSVYVPSSPRSLSTFAFVGRPSCVTKMTKAKATTSQIMLPPNDKDLSICIPICSTMRMTSTTTRLFSSAKNNDPPPPSSLLPFTKLPYSGAEIRLDDDTTNDIQTYSNDEFLDRLPPTLEYLISNDYMSCWIHVPISRASLLEHLCSDSSSSRNTHTDTTTTTPLPFGFELHHTNTTTQCIVIKQWIRQDGVDDKIPPYATHQVGCAGFVLNDKNELLLVKEWSGPPSNRVPSTQWKLPGGLLDMGESFQEAACREVWEETGIPCEFESILSFWHRHGLMFGKSDLYYVCLLKPTDSTSQIQHDPIEISDACWMSIDEFVTTQDHPLILHILQHVFDIEKRQQNSTRTPTSRTTKRLVPSAAMVEGPVQFGSRSPFPTFTPRTRK